MLAHYFQIPEREVEAKSVRDPRKSVAVDVAALRANPALPDEWLISGLVYDVATGLVRGGRTCNANSCRESSLMIETA